MDIGEYFGFLIVNGVVQFSTTFIIPKENDKLEEFRFSKHDLKRFRREKCETLQYYDVSCHGLCPYTEKDWEKNKIYMNCTDGLAYHCARDNSTNKYVEACAEAVWCDRGKEPRLIFPPGHNKKARVICRYCHDEDFYNPIEFRLSSTYYECTEYKIPCSRYGIGKIRCDEDGIERHWKDNKCRCNERNMYIESNAACPTDFSCKNKTNFDFTCELYDCGKTSDGYWRNLTKDYCCACEDGYIRNETSNKCHKSSHDVSLQTTNISHHHINVTATTTILMSSEVKINITASTKLTTHRNIIISYIQPTATARPSLSGGKDIIYKITIVVLVILICIVGIICYIRKKRGQDEPIDSPQIEKLLGDPSSPNNQTEASSAQPPTSQSEDPSSANIQNEPSSAQQDTKKTSFANNRNAGGSAQLPSDSSASVQGKLPDELPKTSDLLTTQGEDSTTGTTKNITSTDIIKLITEIDDIEEQQKQAIFKRLEDKRTKEIADLNKLRQQEGSSVAKIRNAASINQQRSDSVCSQESSSANNQIAPGPAKLSKTTALLNTESEGSSADYIQNAASIVQLRSDTVCSQGSSADHIQNAASFVQLRSDSVCSQANNHNEDGSAQIPRPGISVVTESEGSDTKHAISPDISISNRNNKR